MKRRMDYGGTPVFTTHTCLSGVVCSKRGPEGKLEAETTVCRRITRFVPTVRCGSDARVLRADS